MKKIESKSDKDKRQKRNQILIGIIMIAILVLSTAGIAIVNQQSNVGPGGSNYETREYNGIEFTKQDNFWVTQANQKVIAFSYLPDELEDVEIIITKNLGDYFNKPLYLVNAQGTKDVVSFNLLPEFALRVNDACLNDENCDDEDIPIKSCVEDNMIIYKDAEITKVYQEDNCIIIEGDKAKGTDKFLQSILSV